MTIHYNHDLSTATYGSLLRMATRWKGSLWKTVYQDLLLWCIVYAILSVVYRCCLNDSQRRYSLLIASRLTFSPTFANVVVTMQTYEDFLPLTFMLGFYVTLVCGRWWSMIMSIGLIDNLALTVANYLRSLDERAVQYKRAIVRYMCLLQVMVYRSVSTSCKKKYPTLQTIADAGYLNADELAQFSEDNFWLSVHWALALTIKARDEGLIKSDYFVKHIVETCISFRTSQITLWIYSWIPVPLVYTQVVFMTVRLYFLVALVSRQFVEGDNNKIDLYVPIITIFQFIFYVGWLKVAEALLNPFGDDEDDFDAGWFLDRNLNKAQAIVDNKVIEPPKLCDDEFIKRATINGKGDITLQNGTGAASKVIFTMLFAVFYINKVLFLFKGLTALKPIKELYSDDLLQQYAKMNHPENLKAHSKNVSLTGVKVEPIGDKQPKRF